jgi:protein-S-isoprenylcysteine O-methyltransferase Ste14
MIMSDNESQNNFEHIRGLVKLLTKLYVENVKLTVAEKLTVLASAAVVLLVCLVLGIFGLAFLASACVALLALVLPQWACYLIVCGAFIVLTALVWIFRTPLIENHIARFISRLILEDRHGK